MLGFARMGTSQTNAVIRRYSALLVDGALLKVRSDRPEMAQYCTNMLQAATSNCACARLSVRNVGVLPIGHLRLFERMVRTAVLRDCPEQRSEKAEKQQLSKIEEIHSY
jgi:hypothetical protein